MRPHRTHFSTYSAVNACIVALGVFVGSLAGGLIAGAEFTNEYFNWLLQRENTSTIFWVFLCSSSLRILIIIWFWSKAQELRIKRRPELRELVFRISRFSQVSGPVFDWFNVSSRQGFSPRDKQVDTSTENKSNES